MFPNKKIKTYILLGSIFLLALILRVYMLSQFPVGFHIDEASLGYNGYSLLLSGKDENNNEFPLYIDMFGDNRPSGYHYLTIIPVKLFGLSEFSTRLPAAVFGAISIFAMYSLSSVIFRSKKISLLSSLFIAIAPWHVVLSRASGEAVVALFFILAGFAFILHSLQKKSEKFLIIGTISIISSFFFYHTPRVFVPMLYVSMLFFLRSQWGKKKNVKYVVYLILSCVITLFTTAALVFLVSGGTGRFAQVNIFGHPETKLVMNEQIQEDGIEKKPLIETRIVHNKIINYSLTFASNYLEYFSGSFLFTKGGLPIWYLVPGMGLVYIVLLPFIILGIVYSIASDQHLYKVPLVWMIVAPITAAITVDDIPNINRAIVLFPMLELFAAFGISIFITRYYKSKTFLLVIVIALCIFFNFFYFIHQYFTHTSQHRTWYRNNGFKEMLTIVKKEYDQYDKILVTKSAGGIYPLILFYMKYDPIIYQSEGSPKGPDYGGFGKFYFVPQACPTIDKDNRFPADKKILYINKGDCSDDPVVRFTDIYREDGTRAFRMEL